MAKQDAFAKPVRSLPQFIEMLQEAGIITGNGVVYEIWQESGKEVKAMVIAVKNKAKRRSRPKPPKMDPPPLENGARLSRAEFERRYEAMPHIKKAELVEGVVYMPSPVRIEHSRTHGQIMLWIGTYQTATPGVDFGDNATVRLDVDNPKEM